MLGRPALSARGLLRAAERRYLLGRTQLVCESALSGDLRLMISRRGDDFLLVPAARTSAFTWTLRRPVSGFRFSGGTALLPVYTGDAEHAALLALTELPAARAEVELRVLVGEGEAAREGAYAAAAAPCADGLFLLPLEQAGDSLPAADANNALSALAGEYVWVDVRFSAVLRLYGEDGALLLTQDFPGGPGGVSDYSDYQRYRPWLPA